MNADSAIEIVSNNPLYLAGWCTCGEYISFKEVLEKIAASLPEDIIFKDGLMDLNLVHVNQKQPFFSWKLHSPFYGVENEG